jgi:hypothetical protein
VGAREELRVMPTLARKKIRQFIEEGFVRIDQAFPRKLADEGRAILWKDLGCDPDDPATWTRPVVSLGEYQQRPFREAVNTPVLRAAYDDLVGEGRWLARGSLGGFPVRFPSVDDPGDTGWHVDASFPGEHSEPSNFLSWRINVQSRGRALLMLFLFSDVAESDAPTRIRIGSHFDVARLLEPAGEEGMSALDLAMALGRATTAKGREALATGNAGTVYLCHPFLVHAAQINRGTRPRFMAQPPLCPAEPLQLYREDHWYSPVESAIRLGLRLRDQGQWETC